MSAQREPPFTALLVFHMSHVTVHCLSICGLTLPQFQVICAPAKSAREQIDDLEDQLTAALAARVDELTFPLTNPSHEPDSWVELSVPSAAAFFWSHRFADVAN